MGTTIARLNQLQEWTREDVYNHTVDDIVADHNAALAAVDDKWRDRFEKFGKIVMKEKETALAAEREKVKPLVDALKRAKSELHAVGSPVEQIIADALANVKEGQGTFNEPRNGS